jgi:tRNA threonylcarbamoyladenosine biosynthesis protein TsaB
MIKVVVERAGIGMKQIGAVTVSCGPGSYTGLRVGVATAKSIAYSLHIPLVPISSLYALAYAVQETSPDPVYALPMIDARRMEVYCSLFDPALRRTWEEKAVILDVDFAQVLKGVQGPIIAVGDGAVKLKSLPGGLDHVTLDESITCAARNLVLPGLELLKQDAVADLFHFTPTYLKAPNITTPKKPVQGE